MTSLPKIFPISLDRLYCSNNAYLYIPKEVVDRFDPFDRFLMHDTPNYPQIMHGFKKIYHSKNRIKKLLFCLKLQDGIDEYRYRPMHDGYLELAIKNKNKFYDLIPSKSH